jgi:hypothetical protein
MKKFVFSISLFLIPLFNFSQIWCYPGSEWYYTRNSITGNGYAKHTYSGDVLFQSQNCQKINYYSEQYYYSSQTVQTSTLTYYTYVNNGVVYLYYNNTNQFDTLFNFNVSIGDAWYFPYDNNCGYTRWEVQNTGYNIIQGQNLKWLKISNGSLSDTIYERIGALNFYGFYISSNCISDNSLGGVLRCYGDDQIINFKNYSNNCDYIQIPSVVTEYLSSESISVYPNPAKNDLVIASSSNEVIGLMITDALGRVVKNVAITSTKQTIDVSELKTGCYYLQLLHENGSEGTAKFIKE